MQGAAIIFFAYIGFDQVSTTARKPAIHSGTYRGDHRVTADLHGALRPVVAVMTGMVPYTEINVAAPAQRVRRGSGAEMARPPVKIGAIVGLRR